MPVAGQYLRSLRTEEVVDEPLPPLSQLTEEALAVLREVALRGGKEDGPRVAAAKAILEKADVRGLLLSLLEGDEDRLESWLRAELAECEARRAKR